MRLDATRRLEPKRRAKMGQFLTPAPVARFMASMFRERQQAVRLLDAGAGIGSLSAAFVEEMCRRRRKPESLEVTAYEVEPLLVEYLEETLDGCRAACERAGIEFTGEVLREDFIEAGTSMLGGDLFSQLPAKRFNYAILNPPYRKIHSESRERKLLRSIGVETSNLYAGFLAIAVRLLDRGGELVAITPRSFCNGPYFKPFRKLLLETAALRWVHVFESRKRAFKDDNILQENIIFCAVRGRKRGTVLISSSEGPENEHTSPHRIEHDELVHPGDPDFFIRIAADELDLRITRRMDRFDETLDGLGVSVSTGRVVAFRAREFLRKEPGERTVPLIYPSHLEGSYVKWPALGARKPNAILVARETDDLLVPGDTYVLVKRFTAKEERKRVVAAVYDTDHVPARMVGFENHLNYYHLNGKGMPKVLAKGLAAFLNSTLVDSFFRQFSGHTQVNANDLRSLKYPRMKELEALGSRVGNTFPEQDELNRLIEEELFGMADKAKQAARPRVGVAIRHSDPDPVQAKKRIEEAMAILNDLGLPREQQNERSALTLLALLNMKPRTPWSEASSTPRGITQMMDFFSEHYGKRYAPNTRETVRRFTVHQFVQAGLVVPNPDKPSRPTNSPKTIYQVEPTALDLLHSYGRGDWQRHLKVYLTSVETLRKQYAWERKMRRIPVRITEGKTISLAPGGQNTLVKKIIDEFCSRFTPEAKVVYVGDTAKKWAYFNRELLAELGVIIKEHGKIPDVLVYYEAKRWLVLIEAVTSHGPINPKRQIELKELFRDSKAGLVFVTAFLERRTMVKYLSDIAWETEVWVAEAPTHLIHFNGERFLGPYEDLDRNLP